MADVRRLEQSVKNAELELGRLLTPTDAVDGETFCVWVNYDGQDRLIEIEREGHRDYKVQWRKKKGK